MENKNCFYQSRFFCANVSLERRKGKSSQSARSPPVWPEWAIYWTLGNFSKPLATINLPKHLTFLGNFCKGVKIIHFTSEIIFGQLYRHLATFYWPHCLLVRGSMTDLLCAWFGFNETSKSFFNFIISKAAESKQVILRAGVWLSW